MEKELLDSLELEEVEVEYDEVYKKTKRRVVKKWVVVFLTVVLLGFSSLFVFFSETFKLNEVEITGNVLLSDEDIIKYGNIHVNRSIVVAYLTEVEANIESNEIVRNARVSYDGLNKMSIVIEEEPVLFTTTDKIYLASKTSIDNNVFVPSVEFENFEEVEKKDEVLNELIKLFNKSPEVYEYISQISFVPDQITEDRIVIVMRDTNKVYLSTDQISDKMSKYFSIVDSIFSEYGVIYGELSFDKGGEFKPY